MAKEWVVACKECGNDFGYSDWSYQQDLAMGKSRTERCPKCRQAHNQRGYAKGQTYFKAKTKQGELPTELRAGSLGKLNHPKREHRVEQIKANYNPENFGVTDKNIKDLFDWLKEPEHQVAVVVAPTGSGKSTALPYRLIDPPAGVPADQFSKYGQILITQPRIQATRNIPAFVAEKLYGSHLGAGFDIGFRYKNNPSSDWRNRLVYATDGTLINWIVNGQIGNLSAIMIDEAHERSLNIDMILGLLKKYLPYYPHLKLIVASATIDADLFLNFFGKETAGLISLGEKRKFNVRTHFANFSQAIDYANLGSIKKELPTLVAKQVTQLLKRMQGDGPYEELKFDEETEEDYNLDWNDETDKETEIIEDITLRKRRGHILAFLQGEKPIEDAVALIRQAVETQNILGGKVDVLPLYTTLPQEQQDLALLPGGKKEKGRKEAEKKRLEAEEEHLPPAERERRVAARKQKEAEELAREPERVRVILTTNVAETSLTVEGVVYVVETGIINQDAWNSKFQSKQIGAVLHSRAGCKQRWGRAGRVANGEAYCLYTKKQFRSIFPRYTTPQIQRSDLEQVMLTAEVAGIDSLENFDWIEKPPVEELARLPRLLKEMGALDEDGDLTARGAELQTFSETPGLANLMVLADQFACAVEMAPWVAMISKMISPAQLLIRKPDWSQKTKQAVSHVQNNLTWNCSDDLDFCLKIYYLYNTVVQNEKIVVPKWALQKILAKHLPLPDKKILEELGEEKTSLFWDKTQTLFEEKDYQQLWQEFGLDEKTEALADWLTQISSIKIESRQEAWCLANYVNYDVLKNKIEPETKNFLQGLMGHKKDDFIRPLNFRFLNRIRLIMAISLPEQVYHNGSSHDGEYIYTPWKTVNQLSAKIDQNSFCEGKETPCFVGGKQNICSFQKEDIVAAAFIAKLDLEWLFWLEQVKPNLFTIVSWLKTLERDVDDEFLPDGVTAKLILSSYYPQDYFFLGEVKEKLSKSKMALQLGTFQKSCPPILEKFSSQSIKSNGEAAINGSNDLIVDLFSVEAIAEEEEENLIASHQDPEAAVEEESPNLEHKNKEQNLFPFPELTVQGVITGRDLVEGEQILVQVSDYSQQPQPDTKLIVPVVKSETPSPFELMTKKYQVGQEILVRLAKSERTHKNPDFFIKVEGPVTGFTTIMMPEELFFFNNLKEAVDFFTEGQMLKTTIVEIDLEHEQIRLSTLPNQERVFQQVWQTMGQPEYFQYSVLCVGVFGKDNRAAFALQIPNLTEGEYHWIIQNKINRADTPAVVGETYQMKLHLFTKELDTELQKLPSEIKKALTEKKDSLANFRWESGKLYTTQRLTASQMTSLKKEVNNSDWEEALENIYRGTNKLICVPTTAHDAPHKAFKEEKKRARIASCYAVGKELIDLTATRVIESGMLFCLEDGLNALFKKNQWPKGQNYVVGDVVPKLIVTENKYDEESGRTNIKVGLPQRTPQPTARAFTPRPPKVTHEYQPDEWTKVTITYIHPESKYLSVKMLDTPISGFIFVKNAVKGYVANLSTNFSVGQEIEARVIRPNPEKRRYDLSLFDKANTV